jgi:hypothetical protein
MGIREAPATARFFRRLKWNKFDRTLSTQDAGEF